MRLKAISLSFFLLTGLAIAKESKNLLPNSSFESDKLGSHIPEGWNSWQPKNSQYSVSIVPEGYSGKQSLMLAGRGEFVNFSWRKIKLKGKERYLLSGYTKIESNQKGFSVIKLSYYDSKGSWLGNTTSGQIHSWQKGWHLITMISEPSVYPNIATLSPTLLLGGEGQAFFDDILLKKVAPKPEGEILPNGDMEICVGSHVVTWRPQAPQYKTIQLTASTDSHQRGKSLRVFGKSPWGSANSEPMKIDPSKNYQATGYIKVNKGKASLAIQYYDDKSWLGSSDTVAVNSQGWKKLSIKTDMKKFPKITRLAVSVVGQGPDIDFIVDDVSLREIQE